MKNFRSFFYEECPDEYAKFGRFGHITWKKTQDEQLLTEGLITSYPTTSVISMLKRTYSDVLTHIQVDPIISNKGEGKPSGISFYVSSETSTDEFKKELSQNLNVYGYFIAFDEPYNNEIGFFIEPKFPFKIEKKYLKNKNVYHTTHKKYLDNIKKRGLVPKDSQTNFNHDGNRIYLMISDNVEIMNSFKKTIARSKNWNPNDMVILQIDPFSVKDIYIDPNFEDKDSYTSGFTFNNIHPNSIKVLE